MNKHLKGVLTSIAIGILLIIFMFLAILIASLTGAGSGWEELFAFLLALIVSGGIYVVVAIFAMVKYIKTRDDYYKGMLFGLVGLTGVFLIFIVIMGLY